jgi:hypothetical protein
MGEQIYTIVSFIILELAIIPVDPLMSLLHYLFINAREIIGAMRGGNSKQGFCCSA